MFEGVTYLKELIKIINRSLNESDKIDFLYNRLNLLIITYFFNL